jgi:hypothetical protein
MSRFNVQRTIRIASMLGAMLLSEAGLPHCHCQIVEAKSPEHEYGNARLDSVDANYANAVLTDCAWDPAKNAGVCKGPAISVRVPDSRVRAELKPFAIGDQLHLKVNERFELTEISGIAFYPNSDHGDDKPIAWWQIFLAVGMPALLLVGVACLFTGWQPLTFVIGQDGRYSNSKFQVVLWFWIVISSYAGVFAFRVIYAGWDFVGGVGIPQNLLLLSGLSALTYGGAKAITTAKANAADAAAANAIKDATIAAAACDAAAGTRDEPVAAARMNLAKVAAVAAASIAAIKKPDPNVTASLVDDLVKNDAGGLDFGDFQMIVVTLIAVGAYLMLIYHFMHVVEFRKNVTLPDVDTTVLALFGLGQGAYLAKKAGGDLGKS